MLPTYIAYGAVDLALLQREERRSIEKDLSVFTPQVEVCCLVAVFSLPFTATVRRIEEAPPPWQAQSSSTRTTCTAVALGYGSKRGNGQPERSTFNIIHAVRTTPVRLRQTPNKNKNSMSPSCSCA